jgi:succinate dehydrogenase flavin-adding protein (antitoxin of CptAB toxin-antitoxin module)
VRVEPARRSFSSVAPAAAPAAEDLETSYKRLIFHCQQRGWLELDLIMGSFVRLQRAALVDDVVAQEQLRTVAKEENSDLMRWLVEGRPIPEQFLTNPMAVALHTYANSPDKPWYPKAGEGNQ